MGKNVKQCKICGAIVPDNAKFCQKCGGNEFVSTAADDEQTGLLNENSNQYQNQSAQPQSQVPIYTQPQYNQSNGFNNQQTWQQPPVPQNQPKKKKTGLIIGIVAAVLIILAGIGFVAEKVFQEQGHGNNNDDYNDGYNFNLDDEYSDDNEDTSSESINDAEYTKGTFDGATYVNEWADIRLALPEGFSNADTATYSAAENSSTECGAYFMANDTMSLIYICYEKLPTFPVYDEEDYLDSAMNGLKNVSGVTYEVDDVYSTTNIAGYSYATAECNFNNGNGDFVQSIYVRKIDGYMVFISAVSNSAASNNVLVNNITKAN